jgi:hypothetical protein
MQKTIICLFGLLCFAFISGCITKRGTGLNTGNLIKGPDGIWRLKGAEYPEKKTPPIKIDPIKIDPIKIDPIKIDPIEIKQPPSKPVKFPPVKVKPTEFTPKSAIGKVPPVDVKGAKGEPSTFQPTVREAVTNLPPHTPINLIPNLPESEENVEIKVENSHNIEEITTGKLIMTYLIIFLLLTVFYQGWVIHSKLKSKPEPKPKRRNTSKKAVKKTIESKSKRASVLAAKKTGKKKAAKKKK